MVALGWTDETGAVSEAAKPFFKSAEGGAATSVWCATAEVLSGHGGVYCEDCDIANVMPEEPQRHCGVAPWAVDDDAAIRLWEVSERILAQ